MNNINPSIHSVNVNDAEMNENYKWRNLWLVIAMGVSLVYTVQFFRDPDVWWHLALGNQILAHGFPSVEPFSFMHAPNAWVGQQWGYEVVLAWLYKLGGAGLPMLIMGLMGSASFFIAAKRIPKHIKVNNVLLAFVIIFCSFAAAVVLGVRGQVVSVFFSAVVLLLLDKWKDSNSKYVWLLPPLFMLWANLHAGFIFGWALIGFYLILAYFLKRYKSSYQAQGSVKTLALVLGACLLTPLINPWGVHLYTYILQTFTNSTITSFITEWQSPDFHDNVLKLVELSFLALIGVWYFSRRVSPFHWLLGTLVFAATLQAQRNLSLFLIIATPQLIVYGTESLEVIKHKLNFHPKFFTRRPPMGFAVLLAGIIVLSALGEIVVPNISSKATANYETLNEPQAPADFALKHLNGVQIYNSYEPGGYLAYRFGTKRMVYLYGESAVFGTTLLTDYLDIHLLNPNWRAQFDKLHVHYAILKLSTPDAIALQTINWHILCYDSASSYAVLEDATGINYNNLPLNPDVSRVPVNSPSCSS